jgi:hypothetical protein
MKARIFVVVLLLFACGEDGEIVEPTARTPVPGCEAVDTPPCDVLSPDCRSKLLTLTACLRGVAVALEPEVSVITEQEYLEQLRSTPSSTTSVALNRHWERAFVLLELARPGDFEETMLDEEDAKSIAGYYKSETKEIVLVEHESTDIVRSTSVLIHEYVHALQDQLMDLQRFRADVKTEDHFRASRSITEGEARIHQHRYDSAQLGVGVDQLDFARYFQARIDRNELDLSFDESSYLLGDRLFPYDWGARYMYAAWKERGYRGVEERFASPPTKTHTLLASMMGVAVELGPEEPPLPPIAENHQLVDTSTLGAWGVFLTTNDEQLALAWRSDGFWLYTQVTTTAINSAFVWKIRFADAASAERAASFFDNLDDVRVASNGPNLAITGSTLTPIVPDP